jgi:predicted amidohydrolase YtcJ
MIRPFTILLKAVCAMALLAPWLAAQQPADTVLHNGKVLTVDNNFSIVQAVAVRGNRVVGVGTNESILAMAGPNTLKIDLKGRTVIPGLIDTHRHVYGGGEGTEHERRRYPLDWRAVKSKQDLLNQMKAYMDKYQFQPGQWIYFTGGPNSVEGLELLYDQLNQNDLGSVTPNNPVAMGLGIPDFNGFLVNKAAMDLLMSKHGNFIKRYGRYWIDNTGQPDGHLEPPASRLILPYTYDRAPEVLARASKRTNDELNAMGIVTVGTRLPKDNLEAYKWMQSRGELTIRVGRGDIESFGNITDISQVSTLKNFVGSGDDFLWVTGVGPTAVDGQDSRACTNQKRVGEWTMRDGYFPTGQCQMDIEYRGAPAKAGPIQGNYYRDFLMAMGQHGIRLANVHVSGDRSVSIILDIMEELQKQYGKDATKGWAMDHCVMINPKDFERSARLGVTYSCMPGRSINEENEGLARAYGEEVAQTWTSPMKSLIDAGVKTVFETDTGVYVWVDVEVMVNRKDEKGKVWGPKEMLDRPTALRTITRWAADYMLKGDKLGSLENGKLADLLVLDKDYMTIPDDQISEIAPQLTMVDGKIVYLHSAFANEYNLRPAGAMISTYKELVDRPRGQRGNDGGGG